MGSSMKTLFTCMQVLIIITLLLETVRSSDSKIEPGLFSTNLEQKDVIVTFGSIKEMKDITSQFSSQYTYLTKVDRIYAMYQSMSSYSAKCKSSAQSYLDGASYTYHDMWSTNTMIIRDADHHCVKRLAIMKDVTAINSDQILPLIDPIGVEQVETFTDGSEAGVFSVGTSWGLNRMQVVDAWKYLASYGYYNNGGLKQGKGVVVGAIDTGVNMNHVRLNENFRSYAGWKDGYNLTNMPEDLNGHGSHTMGTICGKDGVGVAPASQWIACRGCFQSDCSTSALLSCCEWMLCPHDVNQTESDYRDCSTAPDVISNSWGGGQGDKTFERCALALRAAGIIPVWAIGNEGPDCSTASSPGDLDSVIGVGATNEDDGLCWFSSRGPTTDGKLKPDISAPGMHIKSCWFNSSTALVTISGTSMATPHITGMIALMIERCRLPYNSILSIIQATADREFLGNTSQVCGGTTAEKFPNNFYGYGRANAFEAVKKVVQICQLNYNYNTNSYNTHYQAPYQQQQGAYAARSSNTDNYGYSFWYNPSSYYYHNYANSPIYGPSQRAYNF